MIRWWYEGNLQRLPKTTLVWSHEVSSRNVSTNTKQKANKTPLFSPLQRDPGKSLPEPLTSPGVKSLWYLPAGTKLFSDVGGDVVCAVFCTVLCGGWLSAWEARAAFPYMAGRGSASSPTLLPSHRQTASQSSLACERPLQRVALRGGETGAAGGYFPNASKLGHLGSLPWVWPCFFVSLCLVHFTWFGGSQRAQSNILSEPTLLTLPLHTVWHVSRPETLTDHEVKLRNEGRIIHQPLWRQRTASALWGMCGLLCKRD